MDNYFAVTAPGLESLVAEELSGLGIQPTPTTARPQTRLPGEEGGGVGFTGGLVDLYRANLHLRTASRVLVRLGDFNAAAFSELRKKASRLPWERYLKPGQPVAMHVTCHKSRLYHSGGVAERVVGAIGDHLGRPSALVKPSETADHPSGKPGERPPQLVIVRLVYDQCTISIDSSGELLHRRGYRLQTAKAPLRETLAAAMLMFTGWQGDAPLLDPFCGSGTIAIEAALITMGLPPGRNRSFAFMDWPGYQAETWKRLLAEISPRPATDLPPIQASDRDAGAIQIAQANAERAGVTGVVELTCRAVSAVQPPAGPGWVVTNPPYGLRVSASKDLRNLYAQFGNVLRAQCSGWQVGILCNDLQLLGQIGIPLDTSISMVNGGVPVRLARGRVV